MDMMDSIFLVQKGAMTPMEVCEGLGLLELKNRKWHIQGTCALRGDGLYEGLDWLSGTFKEMRAAGYSSVCWKPQGHLDEAGELAIASVEVLS
ncbi:ADP-RIBOSYLATION FACTOR B1B [Salix purpurea]|uniref:ADP-RIBOSYLATION FACTOR B1B n=1 Tax=Salix purpurea TaxID=77065 RepID=A0A9Q0V987_SALPP|nr:ADP-RIBOSYLATION FACTOR B1B [Salix purpurea]